jgi:hypothetical protein
MRGTDAALGASMSASRILGACFFVGLIACGGAVASGIDGSSNPTDPTVDGGNGNPGSDGGTPINSDGGTPSTCGDLNRLDIPVSRMCMAPEIQFDDPFTLTLALDTDYLKQNSISCVSCTANVSDGTIRIEVDGATCSGGSCAIPSPTIDCTIPSLVSGPYTVFFTHGSELAQFDINASSGGPTSCALTPAQVLDPSNYDDSCSQDFDCTLVSGGADPCQACAGCEQIAISSDAADTYENDYALQAAECPMSASSGPVACGCPEQAPPKCINGKCQSALTNGG